MVEEAEGGDTVDTQWGKAKGVKKANSSCNLAQTPKEQRSLASRRCTRTPRMTDGAELHCCVKLEHDNAE